MKHDIETFRVTGHALIPVKVQLDVKAKDAVTAMKIADDLLSKPSLIKEHIVPGTEDEAGVHDFKAYDAEPKSESQ